LVSALVGAAAHPLTFAGAEVKAVGGASSVDLTERWGQGETPNARVSHPSVSGIGYRRPSPGDRTSIIVIRSLSMIVITLARIITKSREPLSGIGRSDAWCCR
jgi:hypothetical protein